MIESNIEIIWFVLYGWYYLNYFTILLIPTRKFLADSKRSVRLVNSTIGLASDPMLSRLDNVVKSGFESQFHSRLVALLSVKSLGCYSLSSLLYGSLPPSPNIDILMRLLFWSLIAMYLLWGKEIKKYCEIVIKIRCCTKNIFLSSFTMVQINDQSNFFTEKKTIYLNRGCV